MRSMKSAPGREGYRKKLKRKNRIMDEIRFQSRKRNHGK